MQQVKTAVNLRDLKDLKLTQDNHEECLHNLAEALDTTITMTHKYLNDHAFDYSVVVAAINDIRAYIQEESYRESQILIQKINNIFEAKPHYSVLLKQLPLKSLVEAAQERLKDKEAYKANGRDNTQNYDFMVNTLTVERALAEASHPFIVLSLNASNLFNGLITAWKMDKDYALKLSDVISQTLSYHKDKSPLFEAIYTQSGFLSIDALCFDIKARHMQQSRAGFGDIDTVNC